jgi:O-antigen chain-terminating methyltransferase
VSEIRDEDFDLDVLMRRIRAQVEARRGVHAAAACEPANVASEHALRLERVRENAPAFVPKPRYDLADFLAYYDEEFLQRVYRGVLRRNPDSTGCASFLQALRANALSRIEVLGRIRYSREGRAADVAVNGLAVRFALRSMRRLPLIGRLVGIVQYVVRLPDVIASHERFEGEIARREAALRRVLDDNAARIVQSFVGLAGETASHAAKADADLSRVEHRIVDLEVRLAEGGARSDALRGELRALDEAIAAKADAAELQNLGARVDRKADRTALTAIEERMPTPVSGMDPRFDAFYVSLEDRFRGTLEDIFERVQIYIPVVRAANAGQRERPIVDIGCGRGEWLEAFRYQGFEGYGVDTNAAMVDHCKGRKLHAVVSDGLAHLRTLPTSSVGAVTALHLAEHVPFSALLALIEEAGRVLHPGGVLILETPNPENLQVGADRFYIDPTHQRPIPPPLLQFVAEHLGFVDVEVLRLHPMPKDEALATASCDADRLNGLLFGPQDYAVIARKQQPASGSPATA